MALECYNPNHDDAVNGWVALTAASPWPLSRVLHIRDTAVAISGASPNGTATSATITLPGSAWALLYGFNSTDSGTVTAGSGYVKAVFKDVTYATNTEPLPAVSVDAGTEAVPRTTADANEYGALVGIVPTSFKIRFTALTYSAGTTINISAEVHLV